MRPHLVIGLGNRLMGDEGIGCLLAERLATDPRLPADVEIFDGGADLLACADRMGGRTHVTLLDALLDPSEPGAVRVFEDDFSTLETSQSGVHAISAVGSLQLLQAACPELRDVRFKLITVAIDSASFGPGLSPPLAASLPRLLDEVLRKIGDGGDVPRFCADVEGDPGERSGLIG